MQGWIPSETKDQMKLDILRRTIIVSYAERLIESELGEIGVRFGDVRGKVDTLTQGVWLDQHPDNEIQRYLETLGTRRIILTQRYKFSGVMADNLVKMMFSSNPDVRAHAKFDLLSKLSVDIQNELMQDSGKVLEIVCAEAHLTTTEILYLVFQRMERSLDRTCIYCSNAINLEGVIYHAKCKVVEWLIRYARFGYDDHDQYIFQKPGVYIDGNKRAAITSLLRVYAQLKRDIIVSTPTETAIYKREDDGTLAKITARRQRESDIVGSYAWRVAHGLTPPHKAK